MGGMTVSLDIKYFNREECMMWGKATNYWSHVFVIVRKLILCKNECN